MTFSSALSSALSGMTAAQLSIEVRGHNVANALTPGYARREVVLDARTPSGGVIVTDIARAGAGRTEGLLLSAGASSADASARSEAAGAFNRLLGEPGDEAGLYASYTRFEAALADLSATPESASYQASLLGAAEDLTRTFARIGDGAQALRSEADAGIAAGVDEVNRSLAALHELNQRVDAGGLSDLPEQRQALIDRIGSLVDMRVRTDDAGRVRISTAQGVPLLGDAPQAIAFDPAGVVAAGNSMATGHLSGLSVGGIDLTPGAVQGIATGELAGLFAVRDQVAPAFADRVDALASDLVARFAEDAVDPTKTPGADGLFTAVAGAGVASRLSVNAAVDPARGGALFRLRDGLGATSPGPAAASGVLPSLTAAFAEGRSLPAVTGGAAAVSALGALEALASSVGTERLATDARAAATGATANGLRAEMLSATGVSTDEELQQLLLIEQAYAANARVVQAVSDMMATLLEI